jgi:hypothetical protein
MFELQTIFKLGKPYLKKWRLLGYLSPSNGVGMKESGEPIESKLPFTVRIHKFFQRDEDLFPHNHPWEWAVSFIFWGGYKEMKWDTKTGKVYEILRVAPAINFIRHSDYHMVTDLIGKPLTLFITGPKTSSWGFLVNNVHIPWKKFLGIEDGPKEENKISSRYY